MEWNHCACIWCDGFANRDTFCTEQPKRGNTITQVDGNMDVFANGLSNFFSFFQLNIWTKITFTHSKYFPYRIRTIRPAATNSRYLYRHIIGSELLRSVQRVAWCWYWLLQLCFYMWRRDVLIHTKTPTRKVEIQFKFSRNYIVVGL